MIITIKAIMNILNKIKNRTQGSPHEWRNGPQT
jgi:hypothetical protein